VFLYIFKVISLAYNILTNGNYAYIFYSLAGSSECPVNKICNAREQVPSTINQGDANPVEDCPCINGNPFMHVMTQVTEDTVQTVAWKKRYLLSYNDVACHLKFTLTSKTNIVASLYILIAMCLFKIDKICYI